MVGGGSCTLFVERRYDVSSAADYVIEYDVPVAAELEH